MIFVAIVEIRKNNVVPDTISTQNIKFQGIISFFVRHAMPKGPIQDFFLFEGSNLKKKCSLQPLKKDLYLKITFFEFIHFRVNIMIMIKNIYLFEIEFMKKCDIPNVEKCRLCHIKKSKFILRVCLKGQRRHFSIFSQK